MYIVKHVKGGFPYGLSRKVYEVEAENEIDALNQYAPKDWIFDDSCPLYPKIANGLYTDYWIAMEK